MSELDEIRARYNEWMHSPMVWRDLHAQDFTPQDVRALLAVIERQQRDLEIAREARHAIEKAAKAYLGKPVSDQRRILMILLGMDVESTEPVDYKQARGVLGETE